MARALIVSALLLGSAALAQAAPSYVQSHAVAVGAPDRWDYLALDAPTHRLYVSHFDRVDVMDSRSGAMLGTPKVLFLDPK